MVHHKLDIADSSVAEDAAGRVIEAAKIKYKILEKNGLFKNGRLHKKGTIIELDPQTAEGFIALGAIKEK